MTIIAKRTKHCTGAIQVSGSPDDLALRTLGSYTLGEACVGPRTVGQTMQLGAHVSLPCMLVVVL